MRILLYTGKGGVGKTSISAATAVRCADMGYRTIVISTDAAHSLADSFDRPLGPEPVSVAPNLWGQELDVLHQMEKYWGNMQRYLASVFSWRGLEGIIADELAVLPGMEELASLLQVVYLRDSGDFDVIIIDCAPTGATLQLLTLPEVGRWYLEKIFPLERRVILASRPLIRAVTDMPIPDEEVFDSIAELTGQLDRMRRILTNPDESSVRLVLNPEKMVIKEAQRAYTYLNLYGYPVDAVISNRILPAEVSDTYFSAWRESQARYSTLVEEAFSPLPILQVPMFEREVVGMDMLRRLADALFADRDPSAIFYRGRAHTVVRQDNRYILRIPLPFVSREEVHLVRSTFDELVIRIGNWKRNITLPRSLANLEIEQARHRDGLLEVEFAPKAEE